jgi:hypothetical protein
MGVVNNCLARSWSSTGTTTLLMPQIIVSS